MNIGLIGLQNSGKTTVYNALTNSVLETGVYSETHADIHQAIITIPDSRVSFLSDLYKPKKTIYANLNITDFAGIPEGFSKNGNLQGQFLAHTKNLDAIGILIRNFNEDIINAALGDPDPIKDLETIYTEFILSDLMIIENRLERIDLSYKRGVKTQEIINEERILKLLHESLSNNIAIKDVFIPEEDKKKIKGFQFLTMKPVIIILNSCENIFNKSDKIIQMISEKGLDTIEFAGKFEMEINSLEDLEAIEFMKELNISGSAKERLTSFIYKKIGLIVFFTVGSDEVRAWTVNNRENIVEAAGKIHSDLARGFIRAEVFHYDDIKMHKQEKKLKELGLVRLEGKDYQVKDGDIINIRFSV